jgi:hypothetical protein
VESSLLLKWNLINEAWQTADQKPFTGAPIWQKIAALHLPLDARRRGARQLKTLRNAGAAPAPGKEN